MSRRAKPLQYPMSQAHLRQLYAALTQRGWKVTEHQRGDEVVEVRGAAAWAIRRHDGGPALLLDFAGFSGMGEDIPLDQSGYCQLRGHSIGLYFSRVNRSRETWLNDLNEFVRALESAAGWHGKALTGSCLRSVSELKSLEVLLLNKLSVKDEDLRLLQHLGNLHSLYITEAPLTGQGFNALSRGTTELKLVLEDVPITDRGLSAICDCPQLTTLSLNNVAISDDGMPQLAKLRKLRALTIHDVEISDASIPALRSLSGSVRRVQLELTGISEAGYSLLKRSRPDFTVSFISRDKQK